MTRVLASVRGHVRAPCLLELDLERQSVIRTIEVDGIDMGNIPESKRGFSGIALHNGSIYAATWDRVCVLDAATGRLQRTITDRRFSDLHGIQFDENGALWVTSTNLDSVYRVEQGKVVPAWRRWEYGKLGEVLEWQDKDYRGLTKEHIPYHSLHVNSVIPTEEYLLISYLGHPPEHSWLRKRLVRSGILARVHRAGGILVINRETARLVKHLRCEGLHDPEWGANGKLYYTEYFGNGLLVLDVQRLATRHISLVVAEDGYLTRGAVCTGDGFWVGHTQKRGWSSTEPQAMIRHYDHKGRWLGEEIVLPGYVGVYELIAVSKSSDNIYS